MCGRYQFADSEDIEELRAVMRDIDLKYNNVKSYKTGEVFPTDESIVYIKSRQKTFEPDIMKWGFPKWDSKGCIINAKSETARQKQMFCGAMASRRCVIPSTGFYEWKAEPGSKAKKKYHFTTGAKTSALYMAGVYNFGTGGEPPVFVILTTGSNGSISDVHSRMPVVLYREEIFNWLNDNDFADLIFGRSDVWLNRREA